MKRGTGGVRGISGWRVKSAMFGSIISNKLFHVEKLYLLNYLLIYSNLMCLLLNH